MNRRDFLASAGASGALGLVGIGAPAVSAATAPAPVRFRSYVLDVIEGRFVPLAVAHTPIACGEPTLNVCLDGFHPATGMPVVQAFRLSALFDVPGAAQSPFHVWHFDAATPERGSRGFRFLAGRATMRGFRIDYRLVGETACSERCAAVAHAMAPLQPGHYLLAGPRRDGSAVEAAGLAYSGDPARPLALAERDFDYLAFRIETTTAT